MEYLKVKKLHQHAILPFRATKDAAGYDLCSVEACLVPARGGAVVRTGLSLVVPPKHYGRIAPRSSLALKFGIDVGGGVVDSDYRGEVKIILFNLSDKDFEVYPGDKVAQLVLERISLLEVLEVKDLDETERGEGGFGSTGNRA